MAQLSKKYKFAVIATDVVVCTVRENRLQVLLIQMKKAPFARKWAAPGGLVRPDESVDEAAERHLYAKTGVKNIYLEQLYTFGDVDRDPFGRVVSVAYMALIPSRGLVLKTSKEHSDVQWFSVGRLPKLAYDHQEILRVAVERLRAKLGYTNIVQGLLPKTFTLTELQKTYEIILGRKLDKRNFRKKLISLQLVKQTGEKERGVANRPAVLFQFTSSQPRIVEIL